MTPPVAPDSPPPFPAFPNEWPPHVKRFLTHLALQKLLELHDGWYGLVEYLYRGRAGPLKGPLGAVRWTANAKDIWPVLTTEAEQYEARRQAAIARATAEAEDVPL